MKRFVRNLKNRFNKIKLTKRGQFVLGVLGLTAGVFITEYTRGNLNIFFSFILAFLTVGILYLILRQDIYKRSYIFPIFILPFFFSLSFSLFYSLIPQRFLTRMILALIYSFGLYSLFLTQNIFVISSFRTINLLRSARIVSFVITIFVLFFLFNIAFSLRFPILATPILVGLLSFLMSIQFLWSYQETKESSREVYIFSGVISVIITELSLVLSIWPVTAAIYSIFLTGMFYTYSGLSNIWLERRLFKGVLWEYIWVGLLSILFLLIFSKWGT